MTATPLTSVMSNSDQSVLGRLCKSAALHFSKQVSFSVRTISKHSGHKESVGWCKTASLKALHIVYVSIDVLSCNVSTQVQCFFFRDFFLSKRDITEKLNNDSQ